MRFFYFLFLFVASLLFQSTLLSFAFPHWVLAAVDLPLLVVVHIAITRGKLPGMFTGLLLGYLQDAMAGGILGFNAVAKITAGFTGGYLREKFFLRKVAHRATSVAGAVMLSLVSKLAVLAIFAQPRPGLLSPYLISAFLGNTLMGLAVHYALSRFEVISGVRQEEELSLGD